MTEAADARNLFRCPQCGAVFGELVEVAGRVLLRRSGLYIEWMPKAYCSCGQFIVFSASSRKLEAIIARRNVQR